MAGRPRALEELKTLLSEREPLYARCEVQLDTSKIDPESAVATLTARFG